MKVNQVQAALDLLSYISNVESAERDTFNGELFQTLTCLHAQHLRLYDCLFTHLV